MDVHYNYNDMPGINNICAYCGMPRGETDLDERECVKQTPIVGK